MSNASAEYGDLKVAWHLPQIAQLRKREVVVPPHLQIIISDLCNEDCNFCAYRMAGYTSNANFGEVRADGTVNNNPARFIPLPKALEILDDAASLGVEAIEFTGGGEPTVHPHHDEIFAAALDAGLSCALVSNGVRLKDTTRALLPQFAWVRYSLDAAAPQTYAAMRGVKPQIFDQVLKNARALADEIKAAKSETVFGISFIVTKDNYRETYEAAELAVDIGAQYIRFGAIFTPEMDDYYTRDMLVDAGGGIEMATSKLHRPFYPSGFRIINMLPQRVKDLEQGRPDYQFCGYQHLNMYIGGDLNVYRCCNTAYNDLGLTGSLKEQTFRQFIESDARAKAYLEFNAQACKHCAFNGKNRLLNYLADPHPRHVEFA